jgi:hypothetical protein
MNLLELAVNQPLKKSRAADQQAKLQVLPKLHRAENRPVRLRNRRKPRPLKNCAYSSLRKKRKDSAWRMKKPKRRSKKRSTMRKKVNKLSR